MGRRFPAMSRCSALAGPIPRRDRHEWPRLVHAYWAIGVVWGDATLHPLKDRPVRFFTPFFHNEAVRQ